MTLQKRSRGRPKGSGLPDGPRLDRIADLMITRPELSPTTANKLTDPAPNEADIRRIQVKWKTEGEIRLAAARQRQSDRRQAQAQRSVTRRTGGYATDALSPIQRQVRATQRLNDLASGRLYGRGAVADAIEGAIRATEVLSATHNDPVSRHLDALYNSPAMRAACGMPDTATGKLIREIEDSATMQMVRQLERWERLDY